MELMDTKLYSPTPLPTHQPHSECPDRKGAYVYVHVCVCVREREREREKETERQSDWRYVGLGLLCWEVCT